MHDRKIGRLLGSLTERELRRLDFWISDSRSRSTTLISTYESLRRRLRDPAPFTAEELAGELFPELGPEEATQSLKNHLTRLTKEVLRFIAWQEFEADSFNAQFELLRFYNQRQLATYFPNAHRRLLADLAQQPDTSRKLHQRLLLELENADFQIARGAKNRTSSLEGPLRALDEFWLHHLVALAISAREYDLVYGAEHEDRDGDIQRAVDRLSPALPKFTQLLLLSYRLQRDPQQPADAFTNLMDRIAASQLGSEQRQELYALVINIAARMINRGHLRVQAILAEIYRHVFRPTTAYRLRRSDYKNRIVLLSRLQRIGEAEEVLDQLAQDLGPDNPFTVFCRAQFAFDQGEYRNVIRLLNEAFASDSNTFLELDAEVLRWKAAVMGGDSDPQLYDMVFSKYDNLRMRVARTTGISDEHRRNYQNFVTLFKKFLDLKRRRPAALPPDFQKLRNRVQKAHNLANKQWLLDSLQREIDKPSGQANG
ncbi:MAG: hypothetical protein AAGN35_21690 [Bacteroidota bacterium]